MLTEKIKLKRNVFHMRPLAVINSIASYFPGGCKVFIEYEGDVYKIKSFMNLVNFMIAFSSPPFEFELCIQYNQNKEIECLCFMVLKVVIENIQVVYTKDDPGNRKKRNAIDAYKELYKMIEKAVNDCPGLEEAVKKDFLLFIIDRFNLRKFRIKAVLNSYKGMHVAPCTQLASLGSLLNCNVRLDCTNKDGEPQSCDITDTMGLLGLSVSNGSAVYINAQGEHCEESARIIKYILEHIDTTIREWQEQNSCIDKKEMSKELLAFIRERI